MVLTATIVQNLIINKVGDIDPVTYDPTTAPTGVLATMVPGLWDYYAMEGTGWPRIQALFVERDAIKLVLARIRVKVDVNTGQSIQLRLGQQAQELEKMLDRVEKELAAEQVRARRSGVAIIVDIAQVAPQLPPQRRRFPIDPNDPYYTGSPYFPIEEPR